MKYSFEDLCSKNLFIKGIQDIYSQPRYNKILLILFKFGYHCTLMMKQNEYIEYNNELVILRDTLYSFVGNDFQKGNIHHDFVKNISQNISSITTVQEELLKKSILNSLILINTFVTKKKFVEISNESLDYFITKTICIYSIYTMLKKHKI